MTQKKKDLIHNFIIFGLMFVSFIGLAFGLLNLVYGNADEQIRGVIVFSICAVWLYIFFFANSEEDEKDGSR